MATSRSSDVSLVIRARDEASKGLDAVTQSLNSLFAQQDKTGNSATDLAAALIGIDKAAATVSAAADKGAAAFGRQETALTKARGDYVALRVQADYAAEALTRLQGRQSQIGPQQGGPKLLAEQIKLVAVESGRLESQAGKLEAQIKNLEAGTNAARSSLLQLSLTERAAADARATAAASIELEAQALRERASATEQVTEMQRRLNALTGVDRQPAFDGTTAKQSAEILAVADAIYTQRTAREALIRTLREEEAAATELAIAEDRQEKFNKFQGITKDPGGRDAKASAKVFEERDLAQTKATLDIVDATNAAERRLANATAELRAELNPLAGVQERFNQKLRDANELYAKGRISAAELTQRTTQLGAELKRATADLGRGGAGGNASIGLFGLRPYELTNLGYQVNDVATQLASGTSVAQTFAQQGGQILQLFPKISSAIVATFTNPAFLAAAAIFTGIALAVSRAADEAERLRGIGAGLTLSADGGVYSAKDLNESAQALRGYGASIGDATAALKVFADEGINPERLDAFGIAAQNLADITGQKLPEAAQALATGFTGGYDAVAALDDKLNVLSVTERKAIKDAFDSGDAARARTIAFDAFSQALDKAAEKQRGPATEASRSLKKGYDDLLDSLANTSAIQGLVGLFGQLGDAIARATGNAATFVSSADRLKRIAELTKEIDDLVATDNGGGFFAGRAGLVASIQSKQSELLQLQNQQKRADGDTAKRQSDTVAQGTADQQKANLALTDAQDKLRLQGLQRATTERGITGEAEKQLRLRIAERDARAQVESSNPGASDAAKNSFVAQALKNERDAIRKEDAAALKAIAVERERAISQFTSRVVGAEGGTAQNPFSSAKGFGQFTKTTFVEQYRKLNPSDAAGRSTESIVALRDNQAVAKGVIDQYARENARFLEKFGAQVTAGNLYLAHFLGAGGAKKVLTANGATPVDQLGLGAGVLSGNQGYLRTKNGKGRYRTADELETFIAGRVGDTGKPQSNAVAAIEQIEQENVDRQEKLNLAIKQGNDARTLSIGILRDEALLQDTALIGAQRKAAIDRAEATLRKQVEDSNRGLKPFETAATVTPEQVKLTRDLAAAEFDLQNARAVAQARTDEANRPVADLTGQRDAIRDRIDFLRSAGDEAGAAALGPALDAVNQKLRDAIDLAIAFQESLDPESDPLGRTREQIDRTILGLKTAQDQSVEWGTVLGVNAKQIAQAFATSLTNGIDKFTQAVGEGQNVFKAAKNAFLDFAASFLKLIAQMILQQVVFNIVKTVLSSVGAPGIPVATNHTGGIAGESRSSTRTVSPSWFAAAARYHTGGIAGLKPNEIPIIAERGEEILTRGDPRHRANGGGASAAPVGDVVIQNLFSAEDALEAALRSRQEAASL